MHFNKTKKLLLLVGVLGALQSLSAFGADLIRDPVIKTYEGGDFVNYKGSGVKYLDQKEGYLKDKFIHNHGIYYYFDKDGFSKAKVISVNGSLKLIDGTDNSGVTKWINVDNEWRYLENGKVVTGWKEIASSDGKKYWYYFGEAGEMYEDTYTPDGYKVNSDGVFTGEKMEEEYGDDANISTYDESLSSQAKYGVSGYTIDGTPAELFMLSIAGETSGLKNLSAVAGGDGGRAYGVMQFDYRYDLTAFMRQAYNHNPNLWAGFQSYKNYPVGTAALVDNSTIGNTFLSAIQTSPKEAMAEQANFMKARYFNKSKARLDAAGFHLGTRHIAVAAAILSVNINCGDATDYYLTYLDPSMTDAQMIDQIYYIRNHILSESLVNGQRKGTNRRYLSEEPKMAKDMLNGTLTLFSNRTYGGGVEWNGSTFARFF